LKENDENPELKTPLAVGSRCNDLGGLKDRNEAKGVKGGCYYSGSEWNEGSARGARGREFRGERRRRECKRVPLVVLASNVGPLNTQFLASIGRIFEPIALLVLREQRETVKDDEKRTDRPGEADYCSARIGLIKGLYWNLLLVLPR
jgi:hypothetical protein